MGAVDDLVTVAHAAELALGGVKQLAQHAERCCVHVVHLVHQQHLQVARPGAQAGGGVALQQAAGQVVSGVVGAAKQRLVGQLAAADAFVRTEHLELGVANAQVARIVRRGRAVVALQVVFQRAFEPQGHGQKVFDKARIARAGQLQLFRPALGFVGLDALHGLPHIGAQGFLGVDLLYRRPIGLLQHGGAEGVKAGDAKARHHGRGHANFAQRGLQGLAGGVGVGEGQAALGRHAGGPRLGHAQCQRGGFGGARVGLDDEGALGRHLHGDLLVGGGDVLGLVRVNGRQRESSGVQGLESAAGCGAGAAGPEPGCAGLERLTKLSEAVLARHCVVGSTSSTTRHSNDARRVLLAALSAADLRPGQSRRRR